MEFVLSRFQGTRNFVILLKSMLYPIFDATEIHHIPAAHRMHLSKSTVGERVYKLQHWTNWCCYRVNHTYAQGSYSLDKSGGKYAFKDSQESHEMSESFVET